MHNYFRSIQFKVTLAFSLLALVLLCLGASTIVVTQTLAADAKTGHGRELAALTNWIAGACMIAGAIIAFIAARHLITVVCGGLHRQTGKFGEMASFLDFSKRSASPRRDEFGTSARAFDGFLQRVEDVVVGVVNATASVATATREIAAGNMDLSIRTEQQAASLEQTAHSMRQLTEAIRSNTDNALRANTLADGANTLALSGSKSMQTMSATIGRLDESSKQISEITALIDGIAFQTNILALNAAVEAARAGSQGRGFAVVASEVRNLAHRSSAAAKEIKVLIDASVSMVQDGLHQAHEVRTTVEKVQQSISAVSDIVNAISAGSVEQRHGIEKISAAIAQMDQSTQQNAAMVEQVAAAAQSLEEQAGRLNYSVSAFKVSNTRLRQGEQTSVKPKASITSAALVAPIAQVAPVALLTTS
ncbi:methyl-accepting chemotaxis protein [Herbaspirillum rhizosphaerae]|uniref:Methyl-accepting chemotaxis protein n=1 Tax=Herbaspirillum rhizosphaerae TaxID=346179 RepID=A0ABW8Z5J4_9BURK